MSFWAKWNDVTFPEVTLLVLQVVTIFVLRLMWAKVRAGAFNVKGLPHDPQKAKAEMDKVKWGNVMYLHKPNGAKICAVYSEVKDSKLLIIYSHGNGGDLTKEYMQERCKMCIELGVSVLTYDYSGYGASEGQRSEKAWVDDLDFISQFCQESLNWKKKRIIQVGQSIGTGVTMSHLQRCGGGYGGVVLFHPYKSIIATKIGDKAKWLRLLDLFINENKMSYVDCEALIVHGTADSTVPYEHGVTLANLLKKKRLLHRFVPIKNGGHGNIFEVEEFKVQVSWALKEYIDFLKKKIEPTPTGSIRKRRKSFKDIKDESIARMVSSMSFRKSKQ